MRTNTTSLFVLAVILALGLAACASEGDVIGATPPANTTVSAEPSTGQAIAGQAPTARDGSPTVIILEPRIQTDFPIPTDPVVLDQLGMAFLPPVLLAQVNQPVHFRNSEDVLHNVRVYNIDTQETAFNISTPIGGVYEHRFDQTGTYRVACDIHSDMGASVIITTTPYTAVAERDGSFILSELRPGSYTAIVHAGTTRTEQLVEIDSSTTTLTLTEGD